MYPKFVEVNCELGDDEHRSIERRFINVENIVAVFDHVIDCGKDGIWYTDQTYDDIKALISDCGCLIHKADPRLDMTHPLTMEDLQSMVGEPVWNSNLDRWELVTMVTDLYCKTCHTGQYAGEYDENDLIKTPLYRMRQ